MSSQYYVDGVVNRSLSLTTTINEKIAKADTRLSAVEPDLSAYFSGLDISRNQRDLIRELVYGPNEAGDGSTIRLIHCWEAFTGANAGIFPLAGNTVQAGLKPLVGNGGQDCINWNFTEGDFSLAGFQGDGASWLETTINPFNLDIGNYFALMAANLTFSDSTKFLIRSPEGVRILQNQSNQVRVTLSGDYQGGISMSPCKVIVMQATAPNDLRLYNGITEAGVSTYNRLPLINERVEIFARTSASDSLISAFASANRSLSDRERIGVTNAFAQYATERALL